MTLAQHEPFASDLIDDIPARRPWWLPATEPDADWAFHRSGEFPVLADPALKSSTEEEGRA
jgi:hypothetical protein